MSDRPCASIVVPFFNSEGTLEACIESLLAQDDIQEPYEIILVNNRSTDASESIAARHHDVLLLSEQAPGPYMARNAAIRRASAPLIAFTDSDCVADPMWLRSILDGMLDPQTAILIGYCRFPAEASLALRLLQSYENAKADYVANHCPRAHHYAYCNNMAVRKSVFDELGLFEEWPRAADSELVHRLAARRPDLKLTYRPSMRVNHLEFTRGRTRASRLRLYVRTNSRIATFRELSLRQRLGVLMHLIRVHGA